jgi:hypothetical protein
MGSSQQMIINAGLKSLKSIIHPTHFEVEEHLDSTIWYGMQIEIASSQKTQMIWLKKP